MNVFHKKLTHWSRAVLLPVFTALPFVILALIAPPLYILNDDLQIASVLSGAYSGTPDLHTVYMRAPLSFVLSLFYRLFPAVPWFGLFLCGTVYFCTVIILHACVGAAEDVGVFFRRLLPAYGLLLPFVLPLFWKPHYTVVAACAGGTALFLLLYKKDGTFRDLLPSFFLLLLCDQIRSQVFYLLLPFLAVAWLFCILLRDHGLAKNDTMTAKPAAADSKSVNAEPQKATHLRRNLMLWGGWALCWLALTGLDALAYSGAEWQAYRELNDARTELYDYTLVWESEEAHDWYRACGVEDAAYPLYRDYALLPDDTVTAQRLRQMAAFREPSRTVSGVQKLKNVLYDLRRHLLGTVGGVDVPYSYILIAVYAVLFYRMIREKRFLLLLPLAGSGLLYLLVYGWLLWRGRLPDRVVMSLYLIVLFLLFPLLLEVVRDRKLLRSIIACLYLPAVLMVGVKEREGYLRQNTVNRQSDVVYSYIVERPQELFLTDTFTMVDRTAPVFAGSNADGNILLLGGWLYGSPLQAEKIRQFGYADAADIFRRGGAYFICRSGVGIAPEALERFLSEHYGQRAKKPVLADSIRSGEDTCLLYRME